MTTKTAPKTTRTPRKGATIAAETEQGELVVIAETQHIDLSAPKKLTNRELAVQAIEAWNTSHGAQLVFRGHVKGALLADGEALFSVFEGEVIKRARIITLDPQTAQVSEVFDPTPSKVKEEISE